MSKPPLHIIILAAGKGSRMRSELPKVLHQVGGKALLAHVIDAANHLNPAKVHVVVGHGKQQVIDAFAAHPESELLNWVEQKEQLGTGHAVAQALPEVEDAANVLILTADVPLISAATLESMQSALAASPLAVLTAEVDDPFGLGRIMRNHDGGVISIVEEKDASAEQRKINEINSGIIAARAGDLKQWLRQVKTNNAQAEYYLTDVIGIAANDGAPVIGLSVANTNEVMGINSRVQLAEAERAYQSQRTQKLMESGVTMIDPSRVDIRGDVEIGVDTIIDINVIIEGPSKIGRNCTISANCVIQKSELGDGTQVHPNTVVESAKIGNNVNLGPFARIRPGSDFGDDVRIGNFVETKKAVLHSGVKVNHLSYVGDAEVGNDTNIGAGVITCNYDGANKHHTQIGNNVFVGSDSQLVAPVTIGDGATIGAGSTITSNVKDNELAISRGKQRQISGWQRPTKNK